jgi:hypothetical protein
MLLLENLVGSGLRHAHTVGGSRLEQPGHVCEVSPPQRPSAQCTPRVAGALAPLVAATEEGTTRARDFSPGERCRAMTLLPISEQGAARTHEKRFAQLRMRTCCGLPIEGCF